MKRNFKLKFCKNCILPNTRPNLIFDKDGVCDACRNKETKINWTNRRNKFLKIVSKIKNKNKNNYDCVIPVSGGKDSTWQVITAINFGLKPLCVTWRSPARNKIGQRNLNNMINLGVDHIDYSINSKVEKYFTLKCFKKYGNPLIPMHMALHAIPVRIAIEKKIPLILWGENSADEYGGKKSLKGMKMSNLWRKKFGVNEGTSATHWVDKQIKLKDMAPYILPSHKEIKKNKINELFLGYFFKWSPKRMFNFSIKYGFKAAKKPKTGIYNFADIDDKFLVTIHHWMKWYKFGFSRKWDNLSIEIREGKISRSRALSLIKKNKESLPQKEILEFCKYLSISKKEFFKIAQRFRNKKIWNYSNKTWKIKDFIIKDWKWRI